MPPRKGRESLSIVECTDASRWGAFTSTIPYAQAYHCWTWRELLKKSFPRLTPHYVFIEDRGGPIAALPLFIFTPAPYFSSLWSSIFHMYGGPLITPSSATKTQEVIDSIDDYLTTTATKSNAYLTALTPSPLIPDGVKTAILSHGFTVARRRVTHLLNTDRLFDDVWKGYHKHTRNAVRKAEKSGVTVDAITNHNDLETFYHLYYQSMRRIHVTPKPFHLVEALFKSRLARFTCACVKGKMVAGLVVLHYNGIAFPWIVGSDTRYHHLQVNNATHNEAIRYACEGDYRLYSFGESDPKNTGLTHFKSEWGTYSLDCPTYERIIGPTRNRIWNTIEPLIRRIYAGYEGFIEKR